MSESLNNQETKQDTKNGFTVPMGLKERNEKEKEPGHAEQGGGGRAHHFLCHPLPQSLVQSTEELWPHKLSGAVYGESQGAQG